MAALRLVLFLLLVATCAADTRPPDNPALRVIVLANRNDPDSVRLGRYYCERRGVPAANLVALPMPRDESITWRQFIDTVYQPLQDELVRRGWIDAIAMDLTDRLGRKLYSISGHHISYLTVCRGVPLRIENDPALYEPVAGLTDHPQFRTNAGAVDSELALLAQSGYPINAMVPNPLFNRVRPNFLDEGKVVKVGRLDGPTYADAAALVDHALEAERTGLIGRAYVDLGGPHPDGDKWLEATVHELAEADFDVDVDRAKQTIPADARFDAPILYFGWYAGSLNGPFARPGFRFPPGAIALHIHSFSAATLRSTTANWCGPLVARGVTATFGNVHEPYLPLTHRPQIIVQALADGQRLGDAACAAIPAFSWQAVLIGDPLYRPFAVDLSEQWERRSTMAPADRAYVALREINHLVRLGRSGEALAAAEGELKLAPTAIVAWKAAQLLASEGRKDDAGRLLDRYVVPERIPEVWVAPAGQIAQFYLDLGRDDRALALYRRLLALDGLSVGERLALLSPAVKAAEAAGASDVVELWRQMLADLGAKQAH